MKLTADELPYRTGVVYRVHTGDKSVDYLLTNHDEAVMLRKRLLRDETYLGKRIMIHPLSTYTYTEEQAALAVR